jgi:hypothetical protein
VCGFDPNAKADSEYFCPNHLLASDDSLGNPFGSAKANAQLATTRNQTISILANPCASNDTVTSRLPTALFCASAAGE